jgi:hypothetical protein
MTRLRGDHLITVAEAAIGWQRRLAEARSVAAAQR